MVEDLKAERGYVETPMWVLSPSGLNTFESCEYKFWLRYGPKKIREPNTEATIRGTLVHTVAEKFQQWKYPTFNKTDWKLVIMDKLEELFESEWADAKELHDSPKSYKDQTWMMIRNYGNNVIRDMEAMMFNMPHFGIKGIFTMAKPGVEVKYDLIEEYGIQGTIDELISKKKGTDEDDYVIISDLKTSKIFKVAWGDDYKRQLTFYALMYYLKHGHLPSAGCIKFLAHGKECYMEFTMEGVEAMLERIKEIQEKARTQRDNGDAWEANTDSQFCKWCWCSTSTYDEEGNVTTMAPCEAGWRKWSEDGNKLHGFKGDTRYLSDKAQ